MKDKKEIKYHLKRPTNPVFFFYCLKLSLLSLGFFFFFFDLKNLLRRKYKAMIKHNRKAINPGKTLVNLVQTSELVPVTFLLSLWYHNGQSHNVRVFLVSGLKGATFLFMVDVISLVHAFSSLRQEGSVHFLWLKFGLMVIKEFLDWVTWMLWGEGSSNKLQRYLKI